MTIDVAEQDAEQIRIRVSPDLKAKWSAMLEKRKISQQAAVVALMDWIVDQDPLLQLSIFGQVPESDGANIARIVLNRMSGKPNDRKGK